MQVTNNNRNIDIEAIFNAALARGKPEERNAYLDGACGGDIEVRSKVEALLQAHEEAGNFLIDATSERLVEGPGVTIDRYKILQLIGEGGFGTVYMAEQLQPVRRKVAIKIIKLGMDTKQVIARFEAERQALALMNHPNIAGVFDAGSTESGRPYFVMELVRGVSITEYCDRGNLDSRARLELFLDVCHAVQHAHQKGIIHRDIKPSNVMVTLHDGRPVPKIIDFGVSKATNQRLTEKTLFTEYHQFIGTPQYMSPEQAEMSGLDIDTRSDLYSLGSLLYELLTGAPPFEKNRLREAGYVELQRIICDEHPPKPSTRVVTLVQEDTTVAEHHGIQPQAFSRFLQGDLDCIVMKAMDKDRTRRYDSASELAADIIRYLNDEPVIAAPPGVVYTLTRFVRRHRLGVLASCLVAASLIIGCILAFSGFVQANREARRTQRVADYLHNVLVVSDPNLQAALTEDTDRVVNEAFKVFGDDPATVAAVLNSIALQLEAAGDYGAAEELLQEAIGIWKDTQGPLDSNVSVALSRLGKLLALKGDEPAAEQAFREAISICEKRNDETSYLANAYTGLADLLQGQSNYGEAELLLRRAIRIRREVSPHQKIEIALSINRLSNVLAAAGKFKELEPILDECIQAFREALPNNKATIAKVLTQTAAYHIDQKDFGQAETQIREALEIYQEEPAASQFYREVALRYLSIIVNENDDDSREYVSKRLEYVKYARKILGEEHPRLGLLLSDYSRYMLDHDEPLQAIDLATAALEKLDKTVGMESYVKGALVAAETAARTVAVDPGLNSPEYQTALHAVEILLERQPDLDHLNVIKAALLYRLEKDSQSMAILEKWQSPAGDPSIDQLISIGIKALLHQRLGQTDQAVEQLTRLRAAADESDGSDKPVFRSLLKEVENAVAETNTKKQTLWTRRNI